jgi:hypothetical protein
VLTPPFPSPSYELVLVSHASHASCSAGAGAGASAGDTVRPSVRPSFLPGCTAILSTKPISRVRLGLVEPGGGESWSWSWSCKPAAHRLSVSVSGILIQYGLERRARKHHKRSASFCFCISDVLKRTTYTLVLALAWLGLASSCLVLVCRCISFN